MWRIFRRRTADRPAATPAGRQDCDVCGEQSGHGLLGCPIEAARQEDAAWIRECLHHNAGVFFPGDSPGAPRLG